MRQVFKVKRQARRREAKLLSDLTSRHAFGARDNQCAEDRQARFMSERAERAYNEVRVHGGIIDLSIQRFK